MENTEAKEMTQVNKKISHLYKTGDIQRAIETCQSALLSDPTNADLHVRLGDLYMEWHLDVSQAKSYIDEAITEYQRALETYINSADIYQKIGVALFHKNEIDKAINYFEMAVDKNPKYHDAYYMIAECYTRKARFRDALNYAEKSLVGSRFKNAKAHFLIFNLIKVISPRGIKSFLRRAKEMLLFFAKLPFDKFALKMMGRGIAYLRFFPVLVYGIIQVHAKGLNRAVEIYQEAIEKSPGFVFLYIVLGDIYRALGRHEDAIIEYKMAIWLDSLNISAYRSLCLAYEEAGDYDSAIEIYRKLIEIQPNVAEYHGNLGNILYMKGDVKEAIAHYQNAIVINPNPIWTSVIAQTLGYVFQEVQKDVDASIGAYQTAYVLTPQDMDIYINLGSAFYDKSQYDSALSVYRKALELDPQNAKIHCNLGYLHWGKGDIDEAIKEYELSIKYDSNYDIAYNNLGVIYLDDLGHVKKAAEMFGQAVNCNQNYALAYYNLARSTAIMGDKIEAAKLYQFAMNVNNITQEIDPQDIADRIQGLFN